MQLYLWYIARYYSQVLTRIFSTSLLTLVDVAPTVFRVYNTNELRRILKGGGGVGGVNKLFIPILINAIFIYFVWHKK